MYVSRARGHVSRRGTAGSRGNSMFNIVRNGQTVFHSDCSIFHPHQQCVSSVFLHPHQRLLLSVFDPSGCEVVSHCGLGLHFPDSKRY